MAPESLRAMEPFLLRYCSGLCNSYSSLGLGIWSAVKGVCELCRFPMHEFEIHKMLLSTSHHSEIQWMVDCVLRLTACERFASSPSLGLFWRKYVSMVSSTRSMAFSQPGLQKRWWAVSLRVSGMTCTVITILNTHGYLAETRILTQESFLASNACPVKPHHNPRLHVAIRIVLYFVIKFCFMM